ncbi:MAG: sialate O-acetylesterase, partial [Lacunisphaera sp.]|nr:sialate O-acetylesterase [Lacunisphaera sp.]
LPNFAAGDPAGTKWAALREAQSQTLTLPNTGQAVAIDVGDPANIHPANKQPVGHRLALIAERNVYGFKDEITGPVFRLVTRADGKLSVAFDHAAGLVARGGSAQAVEIAGADRVFHVAQAQIAGDRLTAFSPEVADPVAIRYAWTYAPEAILYNGAGLPAAPFRSDSW